MPGVTHLSGGQLLTQRSSGAPVAHERAEPHSNTGLAGAVQPDAVKAIPEARGLRAAGEERGSGRRGGRDPLTGDRVDLRGERRAAQAVTYQPPRGREVGGGHQAPLEVAAAERTPTLEEVEQASREARRQRTREAAKAERARDREQGPEPVKAPAVEDPRVVGAPPTRSDEGAQAKAEARDEVRRQRRSEEDQAARAKALEQQQADRTEAADRRRRLREEAAAVSADRRAAREARLAAEEERRAALADRAESFLARISEGRRRRFDASLRELVTPGQAKG